MPLALGRTISLLCLLLEQIFVVYQTELIIPVPNHRSKMGACQIANDRSNISNHPGGSYADYMHTEFNYESLIFPYHPRCRVDKPELFEARQCSQYDCFCVNSTTGAILLGTRGSPSEVGNCSTALYSVLLAVHNPFYRVPSKSQQLPTIHHSYNHTEHLGSALSLEQETQMISRIRSSLEHILQSAVGFQRVTDVSKLYAVPKLHMPEATSGGLLYYKVNFLSVGHLSVDAPRDLIQHRLHEGYLPEIGMVDSDISRVELVTADVKVESSSSDISFNMDSTPLHDAEHKALSDLSGMLTSDFDSSRSVPLQNLDSKTFAPASVRSPGDKIERGSRQLPITDEGESHLAGGFVAPPVQTGPSAIHQPWPARTSFVNVLRQPGVIAGIVGSALVLLLLLILLILFCIYRLRKKDEGSYALDESKKVVRVNPYQRAPTREFYA